ncbi:MAG: CHASE domain-containing protein [Desulfuromonadaceae bacterium]|nr:CHASE domain-containing protein [Desulfuromonadaceae bacterium]
MVISPSPKKTAGQILSRKSISESLYLAKWLPLLVSVTGLIIVCLLWQHENEAAKAKLNDSFENRVHRDITLIKRRIEANEQILHGVQGLFVVSGNIDRIHFQNYVATLQLETSYPDIQGVSFALKVPEAQKASHISAVRAAGFPDYRIRPTGRREFYVPVIYLAPPTDSNRRVIGYDTYFEPVRRAAMDRARDTGEATLTGKIRLEQNDDNQKQPGVLLFQPVYKKGALHNSIASRRANIIGWLAISMRIDALMTHLNLERTNEIHIEIYDGTKISDDTLLYASNGRHSAQTPRSPLQSLTNIEIAGQTWTVAISPLPNFERRIGTDKHQLIAVAGVLLTLLLTALTYLLVTSRARAIKAAREMTVELRESEARYRFVADFAYNWEYWIAPDRSFRYVSPSCAQISGYTKDDFYRDPGLLVKIVHPDDVAHFNNHSHDVLANGNLKPIEFRIITRDGPIRWIGHICRPIFDVDGSPMGQRASNLDITEQKLGEIALHEQKMQLEAEIGERQKVQEALVSEQLKLEELNRTLETRVAEAVLQLRQNDQLMLLKNRQATMGEMIHNIAHQWRQPLNSLGLILQNIQCEFVAGQMTVEQMTGDIKDVMELIHFMSKTVDDFRNFFKEDTEIVCFSVQDSIKNAVTLVRATLADHGIALVVAQDIDIQINGHPNEYAQVLLNLLSNAKDVLVERAISNPTITIKSECLGDHSVVTVSDNAGGICDSAIGRVFDPYFTTKPKGKGSGVGLHMSKTIIEEHMGGRLTVANVGEGAQFRIEVKITTVPENCKSKL